MNRATVNVRAVKGAPLLRVEDGTRALLRDDLFGGTTSDARAHLRRN
jgi:hypothetical protein